MITKQDIIRMAMVNAEGMAINVYDLDYYRSRIKFVDDYQPSKPVKKAKSTANTKFKTDRERVKELQKKNNNYKDTRS